MSYVVLLYDLEKLTFCVQGKKSFLFFLLPLSVLRDLR